MTAFSTPRVAALLAALVLPLAHGAPQPDATPVNTFIGTQDEGNTFPGASAPFGSARHFPVSSLPKSANCWAVSSSNCSRIMSANERQRSVGCLPSKMSRVS